MSCAGGGATVLFAHRGLSGNWSLTRIVNGCLAGMVSVAGGCDGYAPWAAFVLACLSGLVYLGVSSLMVRLKIDDPVDAVAVHCGSGMVYLVSVHLNYLNGFFFPLVHSDKLSVAKYAMKRGCRVFIENLAITSNLNLIKIQKI